MTVQQLLQSQFGLVYRTVKANVDGVSAEESLAQPTEGGNCGNWILGHLIGVQNTVMGLVGEDPVWESEQLKRAGGDPITGPDTAIDWDTMVERFSASEERFLTAVGSLSDDQLKEGGLPHPFGGEGTRGELLGLFAFHQAYHAGQLGLSRRLVGHPGVIRAPEPAAASA